MTDGYALEIEGDTFRPVPESWLEHPCAVDERQGSPRLYAVSTARRGPRMLVVRHAVPKSCKLAQYTIGATSAEGSDLEPVDGLVPASLREPGETWSRSVVPHRLTEPQGVLRVEEIDHLRELWVDRVDSIQSEGELVADGGYPDGLAAGQTGEERLVATWSDNPYTGVRKRHITVEHRVLFNWYPRVGADVRHQIRCDERDIVEWVLAEAWEMRDHGVEHYTTNHGRGLP